MRYKVEYKGERERLPRYGDVKVFRWALAGPSLASFTGQLKFHPPLYVCNFLSSLVEAVEVCFAVRLTAYSSFLWDTVSQVGFLV